VWSRRVEREEKGERRRRRINPSEKGIVATMSEERVEGVFLDLVKTGVKALLQPLSLLGELDDVARNIQQLRLRDAVWEAVEQYCREEEATKGGGPMAHVVCPYCGTPNPVGQLTCSACHAPLAEVQPIACPRCGFLNDPENARCVQCGAILKQRS
jgi:DNA-directed RNA polymerase subunit RPC12/RpoP